MLKIHGILEGSPSEQLTESDVTEDSEEYSEVIRHLLAKPFKFTYVIHTPCFIKKMEALVNSFYLVKHKFKLCKPHTKHARIIVLCESKIHVFLFLNCCLSVLLDISNQNFKLRI